MSHFTVLVAADNEEQLDKRLLPYHEYECTGIEEYVVFEKADMEEVEKEWERHKNDMKDNGKKMYPDLDEFVRDYFGYEMNAEGEYGRMTNPNAKWDWWVVGGRWSGLLVLKPEAKGKGKNGQGGLLSQPNSDPMRADSALASEIDWEEMTKEECPTFAFVDTEGVWHQKAEMGWWATTSNENDNINKEWQEFFATLKPEQRLFVVDCHI